MKVLLVNPAGSEQDGFSNPPLGLLYLAGTLEANDIDVKVVDGCITGNASIIQAIRDYRPDFVGVTCLTPARHRALDVCRQAKQLNPSIKTVIGGAHPSIMYKQIAGHYPFVDYIVRGEGESALLSIVTGKEQRRIPPPSFVDDLDRLPFPAWHLIDISKYPGRGHGAVNDIDLAKTPRVSVVFSRGCVGHCSFCSTWWIWQGYRHRSPANMVDEIEQLADHGVKHICFADDSLTVDHDAIMEVCREIIARGLHIAFHATTRSDLVDHELLSALKQAGCYEMSYGIESGSSDMLEKIGKDNSTEVNENAILMTKKAGIKATALITVGNPHETNETIRQTVAFLKRCKPDNVGCLGGMIVLPGTQLYRHCLKNHFIRDDFWLEDTPYLFYTLEQSKSKLSRWGHMAQYYDFNSLLKFFLQRVPEKLLHISI